MVGDFVELIEREGKRILTAREFQHLADVPPEVEWFANSQNANTRRAYRNGVRDFMVFAGIRLEEEFRQVKRFHVIAWLRQLEGLSLEAVTKSRGWRQGQRGQFERPRLDALSFQPRRRVRIDNPVLNADGKNVAEQGNHVVELRGTLGFPRFPGPLPAVEFREFAQRPFGEFGPTLLQLRQRVFPVFSSIQFQPGILFNPPQVGRGGEAEGQTGVVGLLLLRLVLAVFFLEGGQTGLPSPRRRKFSATSKFPCQLGRAAHNGGPTCGAANFAAGFFPYFFFGCVRIHTAGVENDREKSSKFKCLSRPQIWKMPR